MRPWTVWETFTAFSCATPHPPNCDLRSVSLPIRLTIVPGLGHSQRILARRISWKVGIRPSFFDSFLRANMISRSEYERGFTFLKPAARYAFGKLPNIVAHVVDDAHPQSFILMSRSVGFLPVSSKRQLKHIFLCIFASTLFTSAYSRPSGVWRHDALVALNAFRNIFSEALYLCHIAFECPISVLAGRVSRPAREGSRSTPRGCKSF